MNEADGPARCCEKCGEPKSFFLLKIYKSKLVMSKFMKVEIQKNKKILKTKLKQKNFKNKTNPKTQKRDCLEQRP